MELRAALNGLPPTRIDVAELVPEVVHWNTTEYGDNAGRPLDDRRVRLHVEDVAAVSWGPRYYIWLATKLRTVAGGCGKGADPFHLAFSVGRVCEQRARQKSSVRSSDVALEIEKE